MNIRIVLSNRELKSSFKKNRGLVGRIFLESHHGDFPDGDWSDFCVSVLLGWTINAILLGLTECQVENHFLDGPYSWHARSVEGQVEFSYLSSPVSVLDYGKFCDVLLQPCGELIDRITKLELSEAPDVEQLVIASRALANLRLLLLSGPRRT